MDRTFRSRDGNRNRLGFTSSKLSFSFSLRIPEKRTPLEGEYQGRFVKGKPSGADFGSSGTYDRSDECQPGCKVSGLH